MHWQRNRVPTTSDNGHSAGCYALFVSAVLMSGFGGRIGGHIMPRVQLPAVTPKHKAWNKGRIIGQKRSLLPKQVWAIRARLELSGYLRDLALFNVAIDSKLRGCDLVKLAVADLVKDDRVRERVSIFQSKTKKPVQFELNENTRDTVIAWVRSPEMIGCRFMFPSRFHDRPHISTRQYGRLVRDWVTAIGLEPSGYGTHSMRRTKAAEIYRKTGNLRAVQLLLGHTNVDSTVRYLGVELEDALSIAERIDI
jgi:integrase